MFFRNKILHLFLSSLFSNQRDSISICITEKTRRKTKAKEVSQRHQGEKPQQKKLQKGFYFSLGLLPLSCIRVDCRELRFWIQFSHFLALC